VTICIDASCTLHRRQLRRARGAPPSTTPRSGVAKQACARAAHLPHREGKVVGESACARSCALSAGRASHQGGARRAQPRCTFTGRAPRLRAEAGELASPLVRAPNVCASGARPANTQQRSARHACPACARPNRRCDRVGVLQLRAAGQATSSAAVSGRRKTRGRVHTR
jgi:hypothetical protein